MAGTQGIKAGSAFVEATLNDVKLQRGLKRVQRQISGFGAGVNSVGTKLIGAGAAVLTPFIASIGAAAKAETVAGKFAIVFGKNTEAVKEWGKAYAEEVGRSETQVKSFLSGVQDLFVPLGFEEGAATKMSKELTKLAFDLGSFNDEATDEGALKDLQAALTGSGEVMKKYGVLVDEATVKQELLNQGLDPKAATNIQKVMARYSIILRGTTKAQGNAIESAGEWANVQKRVIATLTNLREVIGKVAIDALKPFAARLIEVLKLAKVWAEENTGLLKSVLKVGVALVALGAVISAIGIGIILLGATIGALATIIGALGTAFTATATAAGVMWAVIASPAAAVVAVFGLVLANVLAAQGAFDSMAESGANAFQTIKGDAMEAADVIRQAFMAGDLVGAFKVALALLKLEWVRFSEGFKGGVAGMWIDVQTLWADGVNSLLMTWIEIISKVKGVFIDFKAFFKQGMNAITGGSVAEHRAIEGQKEEAQAKRKQDESLKLSIANTVNDTKLGELGKEREGVEEKSAAKVAEALKAFNDQLAEVRKSAQAARKKVEDGDGKKVAEAGAAAAGMTIASGFSAAAINRNLGLSKDPAKENQKKQKELIEWNKLTALGIKKLTKTINQTRTGATFS